MAKISYLEEKADDLVSTCALNISVPVYYTMHQHSRTLRSSGLCDFVPKQNRQVNTSLKMSTSDDEPMVGGRQNAVPDQIGSYEAR